ncbi:ATP-binding protein [Maridesulfovibrio zosterae]|uniref:ATP-binding protein n=1 Tax=Maridesulfovibrio zosterae TaxID=82171 RepID=UPI000410ACB5|nr:ATP-binding protein [Maridesulfovibrio zosterae]
MAKITAQDEILFEKKPDNLKYKFLFGTVLIVWTLFAVLILFWSLELVNQRMINSALINLRSSVEQDIIYRRWNAMHGGVYGEISDQLKPNKYLHIKNRDVETLSGLKLTKINPSYMNRQVHEMGSYTSGIIAHLTSLNPIRPANKPDSWEADTLKKMESKSVEINSIEDIKGVPYLRLMVPLLTEKACLKCHAEQGYKVGDLRGGISASLPLEPLYVHGRKDCIFQEAVLFLGWLLGCLIIWGMGKLKSAELSSRASQRRYQALVETMTEGTVIMNCEGEIIFCSKPMGTLLGYTAQEITGKHFKKLISDKNADSFTSILREKKFKEMRSFELELIKKNYGKINVLFSPRMLHDDKGNCIGLIAVIADVTRIKDMEKEVFRQQRLSSLGLLAGGVAHEINTPAQYIKANMSFFQTVIDEVKDVEEALSPLISKIKADGGYTDEVTKLESALEGLESGLLLKEADQALNENMQGIQRITDIINSVRRLAGTAEVMPEAVDINNLMNEAIKKTKVYWEPVADLNLNFAADLPEIKCISQEILDVFVSLITNSVDAIADQQKASGDISKGLISVETYKDDEKLQIVFHDTGAGIPEDSLKKIFEPFYSTKDPGKGVGQGLAITHRIIDDHNGTITVKSSVGIGTDVIISLPLNDI